MSDVTDPANWPEMSVFDAIYGLRATRTYQDKPIPDDVLAQILTATTRACSASNTQPWEFVVVTDRAVKEQLKEIHAKDWANGDERRAQARGAGFDSAGRSITGNAAAENIDVVAALVFVFWNPDRGIRLKGQYEETPNPDGTLRPTEDSASFRGSSLFQACQNMMLSAHALGVQSLFTGFFVREPHAVKELLHVPPRMFLEATIFLGYGDVPLGQPKRRALREVVHLNDWEGEYDPKAEEVPA